MLRPELRAGQPEPEHHGPWPMTMPGACAIGIACAWTICGCCIIICGCCAITTWHTAPSV